MKLLDKLKNALFEEEYVEVEEKPKKKEIKKEKIKKEEPVKKDKPIAKKIIQPERKESNIKEEEFELLDEDFEIRKKEEKPKNEFKFPVMEDTDFEIDPQPVVVKQEPKKKEQVKKETKKVENRIIKEKKSKPYGLDDFEIPEPEYGLYEKKEERTYFKPSPIISPIYGILDKNYKKEEIRDKKEIRLTSSYAHENLDLDEVRNKAYGSLTDDIEREFRDKNEPIAMEIEDEYEEDSQLLDLSAENDTPEVKTVTVGDAEEYFEDLGLEYNVDYKDVSKEKASGRRTQKKYDEVEEEVAPVIEVKEEEIAKEDVKIDTQDDDLDEDNLFDLIDSMYDKE